MSEDSWSCGSVFFHASQCHLLEEVIHSLLMNCIPDIVIIALDEWSYTKSWYRFPICTHCHRDFCPSQEWVMQKLVWDQVLTELFLQWFIEMAYGSLREPCSNMTESSVIYRLLARKTQAILILVS